MAEGLLEEGAGVPAWATCENCRSLVYGKRWIREFMVCPYCGAHARVPATSRIDQLLDADGRRPLPVVDAVADPLGFRDRRPYPHRLMEARARTGLDDGVVCVSGRIGGRPVVLAVMDFRFLGGSLGSVAGERIACAAELALRECNPLIVVTASGGARMQEGALSLMQMAKTSQAMAQLDEAGILTITVVTDPTYGGVAASFANLSDVVIAEPGARLGFAGPRVIEQTIGATLPEGFQSAEFLLARGLVDQVVPRSRLASTLAGLLDAAGQGPVERRVLQIAGVEPPSAAVTESVAPSPLLPPQEAGQAEEAWVVVQRSRHRDRPTLLDYVARVGDGFVELRGDRTGQDCPALIGGLVRIGGRPVMLLGHQKGHTTQELIQRRFGMAGPAGHRKAVRLMTIAGKLGLPVVCLVDTPGAHPGPEAEEGGQAVAIAESLRVMSRLPVPVVSVITGEGGSGGALALALADRVYMLENAVYSVISPEGCAAILWQTSDAAPVAASALDLTAWGMLRRGIVDGVVREPAGGAQNDPAATAASVGQVIVGALTELQEMDADELVRRRRVRYRQYGSGVP